MEPVAEFSERFSELIGGMSYTQVGDMIGMSKQTVSAYANGSRNPKKPTIQAIAVTFGVDPAWLLGYNVPKCEAPTPTPAPGNVVKLTGRDGSVIEKRLTDEQLSALKAMVALLPDAEGS